MKDDHHVLFSNDIMLGKDEHNEGEKITGYERKPWGWEFRGKREKAGSNHRNDANQRKQSHDHLNTAVLKINFAAKQTCH